VHFQSEREICFEIIHKIMNGYALFIVCHYDTLLPIKRYDACLLRTLRMASMVIWM
jgi:hypothetical protein